VYKGFFSDLYWLLDYMDFYFFLFLLFCETLSFVVFLFFAFFSLLFFLVPLLFMIFVILFALTLELDFILFFHLIYFPVKRGWRCGSDGGMWGVKGCLIDFFIYRWCGLLVGGDGGVGGGWCLGLCWVGGRGGELVGRGDGW
jgi:hypothetical protein